MFLTLFALPKQFLFIHLSDVFKAYFYERFDFFRLVYDFYGEDVVVFVE
jgi:hypothetical protein